MIGYCTMRIKPSSVKNGDAALRQEAFRADNHFSNASKYSLQGTTQDNGLTGVPAARQIFHVMFKLSLVAATVVIIKSTTRRLSSKDTFSHVSR